MNLETVLYRVEGAVAVVSMNRTKAMNSLNKQIFADLTTAFEAAKADEAVRVVVMNGEGRAFCAGYGKACQAQGKDHDCNDQVSDLFHMGNTS